MKKVRASEVYRRAAELVDDEPRLHACWAIYRVTKFEMAPVDDALCVALAATFSPTGKVEGFASHIDWLYRNDGEYGYMAAKQFRVLMLLLMSEIARDEERNGR